MKGWLKLASAFLPAALALVASAVQAQELKLGYVNSERILRDSAPARAAAQKLETDVVDSEKGKVASVRAQITSGESFDERLRELDALLAAASIDVLHNGLLACAHLFDQFYSDPSRRVIAEERMRSSWGKLPVSLRLELLMRLAESALSHSDPPQGLQIVNEAQTLLDEHPWPLEHYLALSARIARIRYQAGDGARARADADALLRRYEAENQAIVDIDRAGALRPLAEAYQLMNDGAAALVVYAKAIAAGVVNPNSRPRAEDLSATCCSMAVSGASPDAELWSRIRQIAKDLGSPW